ncbi:hypothetical protein JGI8_00001, partial [Candidatus Kryptonium thompsonii]
MRKGILFFLVIVFSLLCFTFAQTQQKKFTIRDMLSINVVSQMDISLDGKSVVFVLSKADFEESKYRTDLYLASVETGEVRQLTFSNEDERNPKFSP